MTIIFFKMAAMRYSCIEKKTLKAQLKIAHLTCKNDKTIQKTKGCSYANDISEWDEL